MSQDNTVNPYDAPDADLGSGLNSDNQQNGRQFCPPQKLKGKEGFSIFSDAWQIYKQSPVMWTLLSIAMFILVILFAIVPVLSIVTSFLMLPLMVGLYIAARDVDQGGSLRFGYLFSGFKANVWKLIGFTIVTSVLFILVMVVPVLMLGVTEVFAGMAEGAENINPELIQNNMGGLMLLALFVTVGSVVLTMVTWFGAPLIALQSQGVFEAIGNALKGCVKNIWPLTLFSLAFLFWVVVASIPFGLGWFVLMPMMYITVYCAYRRIYTCE